MSLRVKRDDTVQVLAGRERGKRGKVREVHVKDDRVIVAEVNIAKRHMKPGRNARQAGIIDVEQPLHISNVGIVCPKCDRPVRIGARQLDDGHRVRVCKRCGEQL
ncbi:MAG TPA: 50S ribosomal protein L24 [Chloroflexota bacterium]|nr:50S ribosomal protein L24 [Chloroflexota bacterium]